jgi:hypothetical protein
VPALQLTTSQMELNSMTDPSKDTAPVILHGATAIASFLFGDDPGGRRKVYHLVSEVPTADRLPVFRLGDVICARPATLLAWIAKRERLSSGDE